MTVAHVLLGVLDVEGLACQVLRGLDVDIDHLRDAVVTTRVHVPVPSVDDKPAVAEVRPRCANCDALLDDTLREAVVSARRDGSTPTNVRVAYCAACGAAPPSAPPCSCPPALAFLHLSELGDNATIGTSLPVRRRKRGARP